MIFLSLQPDPAARQFPSVPVLHALLSGCPFERASYGSSRRRDLKYTRPFVLFADRAVNLLAQRGLETVLQFGWANMVGALCLSRNIANLIRQGMRETVFLDSKPHRPRFLPRFFVWGPDLSSTACRGLAQDPSTFAERSHI